MIIKRDFPYSLKNGANRPLHIWLPDNYYNSTEHYPVMYFFDGHNLYDDKDATYGKSWGMKPFLEGWDKEMILVGIECGHDGQERLSEYLPYPAAKGSHFDKFEPLGGLMALYAAVHYNRWFSKAACVSSAVGFCIRPLMKDMRANAMSPDTRLYLSWGTHEAWGIQDPTKDDRHSKTYGWNKRIAEQAESSGAAVSLFCQVEGYHCEADWEKQVPIFMNFLWMG